MLEKYLKNNILEVKVIPKSSVNKIIIDDNIVKIKITEIPENGKANEAIIKLISKDLKIPKNKINIIKGKTSSNKTIFIDI